MRGERWYGEVEKVRRGGGRGGKREVERRRK